LEEFKLKELAHETIEKYKERSFLTGNLNVSAEKPTKDVINS
jgi:hypothetical protein